MPSGSATSRAGSMKSGENLTRFRSEARGAVRIVRVPLTVTSLECFGPILRDYGQSHAFNPTWVGHARVHLVWLHGSERPTGANPVRDFVPTTRPGSRLPHAWVARAGERLSVLDLLPYDGFTVLAGPEGAAWAEAVAGIRGLPLRCLIAGRDFTDPVGEDCPEGPFRCQRRLAVPAGQLPVGQRGFGTIRIPAGRPMRYACAKSPWLIATARRPRESM